MMYLSSWTGPHFVPGLKHMLLLSLQAGGVPRTSAPRCSQTALLIRCSSACGASCRSLRLGHWARVAGRCAKNCGVSWRRPGRCSATGRLHCRGRGCHAAWPRAMVGRHWRWSCARWKDGFAQESMACYISIQPCHTITTATLVARADRDALVPLPTFPQGG